MTAVSDYPSLSVTVSHCGHNNPSSSSSSSSLWPQRSFRSFVRSFARLFVRCGDAQHDTTGMCGGRMGVVAGVTEADV